MVECLQYNELANVFGGTAGWRQVAVKERVERYVCVNIKADVFDTRIINSADAVVFKIDYLPHAQFYRAIDKIRKMKLPVIYCNNNIDLMLKGILLGSFRGGDDGYGHVEEVHPLPYAGGKEVFCQAGSRTG